MDILYVSTLYPPAIGGAQIQLHCLAKAMQDAGDDVRVLTYSDRNREDWLRMATVSTEPAKHYTYEGIRVTRLGFDRQTRARMAPWAAVYYAAINLATRQIGAITEPVVARAAGTPDLIHLTRIGREFIVRACREYTKKRDIPFILTPNHHPRWKGWRYTAYDQLYREADAMIVYTDSEKETVVNDIGVDADRVFVTGVGPVVQEDYDKEVFLKEHDLEEDNFVLILGQQYKYKGGAAVLAATQAVWEKYPDRKFVFIGPPTQYSQELFKDIRDPRILNLGAVSPKDKAAALASCALLCLPSMQESFGGVYIEAWCYKKAVIGGNIPAIACVIDNNVNGLLTAQEGEAVAGHILALLDSPETRARMGEAGWQKVRDKYSWAQLAEKTRMVYESVLKGTK